MSVLGTTLTEKASTSPVLVPFQGHLTFAACEAGLSAITERLRRQTRPNLLFDCSTMTGYDADARTRFVEWHKQHRAQLGRVAIVTSNPLWHVVIAAMALAVRHEMKAFGTLSAAELWLNNGW